MCFGLMRWSTRSHEDRKDAQRKAGDMPGTIAALSDCGYTAWEVLVAESMEAEGRGDLVVERQLFPHSCFCGDLVPVGQGDVS